VVSIILIDCQSICPFVGGVVVVVAGSWVCSRRARPIIMFH